MLKKVIDRIKSLFFTKYEILELIKYNTKALNEMFKLIKTISDNKAKEINSILDNMKKITDVLHELSKKIIKIENNNMFRRN